MHDANEDVRTEGVGVFTLPSVTHILYPSHAADRDEVTEMARDFISSDAVEIVKSLDPAWRA